MKLLSLSLAAAVIALSFPSCATAPKKQDACCSASGSHDKSCPAGSPQCKVKKRH